MANFVDTVVIDGTRKRAGDGALLVDARVARTGIQRYAGYEVGKPDMSVVRVFRPAEEVFSADTLASFAHRPITNDHPTEPVTADNWKTVAVGQTSDEVVGETIYVRVPLMVSDAKAISDVEDRNKRELSAGYSCDLDFTPGTTQAGEAYDAVQRNIRINHIAIVQAGRAGKEVRIGDSAKGWGVAPIQTQDRKPMKTMMFDGLPIEVTDQAEAAINRQNATITAHLKTIGDRDTTIAERDTAIVAKDNEIGELTVKLKAAETVDVDGLVAARTALVADAHKVVADLDVKGLSDAAVRKAVVTKQLGDETVKDKSDAVIEGMFTALVAGAGNGSTNDADPFKQAVLDANGKPTNVNDNGQTAYEKRQSEAWKNAK